MGPVKYDRIIYDPTTENWIKDNIFNAEQIKKAETEVPAFSAPMERARYQAARTAAFTEAGRTT